MTGVIDVGGGMRGMYGAGVLDRCLLDGVVFDYCCGVSAGSANLINYQAGQIGRTYRFYHEYAFRKQYMSMGNLLKKGNYIDLDYIYSDLSDSVSIDPLAISRVLAFPGQLCVVATRASDGTPHYFSKKDVSKDQYDILKASCCIPLVCKPYVIDGVEYFDGGLSDPLPVDHLLSEGCDRIVVILTRPISFQDHRMERAKKIINRLLSAYPEVAEEVFSRHRRYAESLEKVIELQEAGRALIVAPDTCCGVDTLKRSAANLDRLYRLGTRDGKAIRRFMSE